MLGLVVIGGLLLGFLIIWLTCVCWFLSFNCGWMLCFGRLCLVGGILVVFTLIGLVCDGLVCCF